MPNDFGGGDATAAAIDALSAEVPYERGEQAPEVAPPTPEAQQVPVQQPTPVVTPDVDSLPAPDLSSLDPAARAAAEAAIRGFQATFTQKTQAIAPIRQLADQVGGAEKLQQIADFYQRLDTDREFAAQVRDQLNVALDGNGQPAQQQVPAPQVTPLEQAPTDFNLDDLPPEVANAYRQMQEMQNNIQQTLQQQEQQRYEAEVLAQYTRDEQAILAANPSYTAEDMNGIYQLAYYNGQDLNKAHQAYQAIQQHTLSAYLAKKNEAPTPTPPAGARGEIPTTVTDLKSARQGAIEALRNDPNSAWG